MLGVVPRVAMARMRGMLFDTNKCFLLPTAMEALEQIRKLYFKFNPSELLIVGHTDTTAEPEINDPLSRERADSMKAYLENDVETWLGNYDLERMPGLPGMQTLPPPDYRFEATSITGGVTQRGSYAPLWPSASAASQGLGDAGPAADAKIELKPGQSAEQGVDLPFDLPRGEYNVRFSYDYFRSSDQLPPGWLTGTAEAAPLRINISR